MYPWISRTHDFWLQFCEKSAAYTWTFTVYAKYYFALGIAEGIGLLVVSFRVKNWFRYLLECSALKGPQRELGYKPSPKGYLILCYPNNLLLLLLIKLWRMQKSAKTFKLLVPFHFDLSKGVIWFKVENFAV